MLFATCFACVYHSFMCECVLSRFSCVQPFVTLWTRACQAICPWGFSRREYRSGLQCPPAGELLEPGIEPATLRSPALAGGFLTTNATWEAPSLITHYSFLKQTVN